MSKKVDNGHITPELVERVNHVLSEAAKHRYSTSGVYGVHNQVFKKNETAEACVSCLTSRVKNLRDWLKAYTMEQNEKGENLKGQKLEDLGATSTDRETLQDVYAHYGAAIGTTPEEELAYLNTALGATPDDAGTVTDDKDRDILIDRLGVLESQLRPRADVDAAVPVAVSDKDGNVHIVTFADDKLTFVNDAGETKNMKPGTYTTEAGDSYAVQVGGKATLKSESIL